MARPRTAGPAALVSTGSCRCTRSPAGGAARPAGGCHLRPWSPRPMSVAEIGVALGVPVGVARVLVSDLADAGYLKVHAPRRDGRDGRPGQAVLERLLDGLRAR